MTFVDSCWYIFVHLLVSSSFQVVCTGFFFRYGQNKKLQTKIRIALSVFFPRTNLGTVGPKSIFTCRPPPGWGAVCNPLSFVWVLLCSSTVWLIVDSALKNDVVACTQQLLANSVLIPVDNAIFRLVVSTLFLTLSIWRQFHVKPWNTISRVFCCSFLLEPHIVSLNTQSYVNKGLGSADILW